MRYWLKNFEQFDSDEFQKHFIATAFLIQRCRHACFTRDFEECYDAWNHVVSTWMATERYEGLSDELVQYYLDQCKELIEDILDGLIKGPEFVSGQAFSSHVKNKAESIMDVINGFNSLVYVANTRARMSVRRNCV